MEAKWQAIEAEVATHRQRINRLRAIRRANEALTPWTEAIRPDLLAERARLLAGIKRTPSRDPANTPFRCTIKSGSAT